jgi:hypothetical protein
MTKLSIVSKQNLYPQRKLGIYGNLGKGENADIIFLETVITSTELDNIHLISNIPGSEKWDVKDLFQRDVDDDRVTKDIIPYFKDPNKIKYFSPITLILLPTENAKRDIIKEIKYIDPLINENAKDGEIEKIYENNGFYRLSLYKNFDPIGEIEWNDKTCYLVAIDGQHRLSALKRWRKEPNSSFEDWKIPVVILNIFKVDKTKKVASLLEIVRKTFVYINSKSERINRAREIMLNDESVNSISTQELIEYSHKNDLKELSDRDNNIIPLIFFDWQGKVINKKQIEGPASLKSIEEIHSWFEEYLLGEDGDQRQASELCLTDLTPPLDGYGPKQSLSHADAKRIREQFNKNVQPGLAHLLQNFLPYKKYIDSCREIEVEATKRSDTAKHAFMKLRFGTHNADEDQKDMVNEEFNNLVLKFSDLKKFTLDFTIRSEIGMRGVIYAFAESKDRLISFRNKTIDWLTFSKEFTNIINNVYVQKWFLGFNDLSQTHKEVLTHLIFDESGSIINYKLQQSKDALGSLIVIMIFYGFYSNKVFDVKEDQFDNIWGDYSNNIKKCYEKGLRKFIKAQKQDDWKLGMKKLNEYVKAEAEKQSTAKIEILYKTIKK